MRCLQDIKGAVEKHNKTADSQLFTTMVLGGKKPTPLPSDLPVLIKQEVHATQQHLQPQHNMAAGGGDAGGGGGDAIGRASSEAVEYPDADSYVVLFAPPLFSSLPRVCSL